MKKTNSLFLTVMLFALPCAMFAQETASSGKSFLSNPLFNGLMAVIIILLTFMAVLGTVLKNISKSDYIVKKIKDEKEGNTGKILSLLLIFLLGASVAHAQTNPAPDDGSVGGLNPYLFWFLISVIILLISVNVVLVNIINGILKPKKDEKAALSAKPKEKSLMDVFNASVEVEREAEIMMDHDYDGIKELDNNLPPWWKYGFYFTIIWALVYLVHYHIMRTGDLQATEYTKEVAKAKAEVEEYMKKAANNVDETNVKFDAAQIEEGKNVYMNFTCATCHGKLGEGGVGPNLTDEYWLHGGSVQDIFKSVKYGWPDKGMKSWKEDLSPSQMAAVTSYIMSLKGSNPANGKAPQGDLYKPDGISTDSTQTKTDTLAITVGDTLKK